MLEGAFTRLTRPVRATMTIAPLAAFGLLALLIGAIWGFTTSAFMTGMALGNFIGAGKFVIFAGLAPDAPVGVWQLAAVVVYCDVGTAIFLLAHIEGIYRLPWLGRKFHNLTDAGVRVLSLHPWMRRFTWLGVMVFVAAPFQGTGALLGTIIARLLGMSRVASATAIGLGAACGASLLAIFADVARDRLEALAKNPWLTVFVVACVLFLGFIAGRKFTGNGGAGG
jgi:uncharacterized membrane protein